MKLEQNDDQKLFILEGHCNVLLFVILCFYSVCNSKSPPGREWPKVL